MTPGTSRGTTFGLVVWVHLLSSASASAQPSNFLKPDVIQKLELTDVQVAKIKAVLAEFGPKIAQAEKAAHKTPAQEAACENAIQQAIACGRRGMQAKCWIAAACGVTKDQIAAEQELRRLNAALNLAIRAILTEQQRVKVDNGEIQFSDGYTGFIVIRLVSPQQFAFDDNVPLEKVAEKLHLRGLLQVLDRNRLTQSYRALRGIAERDFPICSAESKELFWRLKSYWKIDIRQKFDGAGIVNQLSELPDEIDVVYREVAARPPSTNVATRNPKISFENYLRPAPEGIDALFAWTQPNGRGAGIGLADVEGCWNRYHEDLIAQNPLLVFGDIDSSDDHGTEAIGAIVSSDNFVGGVGIAPCVDYVFLTSEEKNGVEDIALAICQALRLMNVGDVFLIEEQTDCVSCHDCAENQYLPIETQVKEFDAIRFAVSLGIIVVEPTGNGNHDLDNYRDSRGRRVLNRNDLCYRDSGAIMVGASDVLAHHMQTKFSSYGSRVDCFAQGRQVFSTGGGDLTSGETNPNLMYTGNFNGTSASAPIIAGAAIILQGMAKANSGVIISPFQMRAYLSNPATGTVQSPGVVSEQVKVCGMARTPTWGTIGIMPNLKAIIQANPVFQSQPQPWRTSRSRLGLVRRRSCWRAP